MRSIPFSEPIVIDQSDAGSPNEVLAADIDGDNDLDVLFAASENANLAWYENDGMGMFGPLRVITSDARGAESLRAVDLDGDDDLDVLTSSSDMIAWYENTDGLGTFGTQQIILTTAGAGRVDAADLDGDGDNDVIYGISDELAWCENLDGAGNFGSPQILAEDHTRVISVQAADMDGDGDMDVMAVLYSPVRLIWWRIGWNENLDGHGNVRGPPIASLRCIPEPLARPPGTRSGSGRQITTWMS